jgi:hypothetical protein
MIESLDEVKAEIERIFPHALAVLMDQLNQQYNDGVAALDKEAAALAAEYAGIAQEARKLAAVLPSTGRCRAALKARIRALSLSMVFRDLTTCSLSLNPGFVCLNPGRSYA